MLRRPLSFTACLAACIALAGCGVHAHRKPERIALRHFLEARDARPAVDDPGAAARSLESHLADSCDAATLATLADLCFQAAHRSDGDEARGWFRDAAVYSAFALGCGDDCCGTRPRDIHNRSVENLIRSSQDRRVRRGRSWQCTFDDLNMKLDGPPFLSPCRFDALEICCDYEVTGMDDLYGNEGVGVPLIAVRENDRESSPDPMDRYYSYDVNAAATAVIHPSGTPTTWRSGAATLYLYDPFETRTAVFPSSRIASDGIGVKPSRAVILASDRTTPLAAQEHFSSLEFAKRVGLFRPDRIVPSERGLYLYQPYRPGKIPVVLVHGIFSSPSTWTQTVNFLQNDPELADRYQVWLFLYPTGSPIPASAADLRQALRDALHTFDPECRDPALRQMVLVGHSMGAIISKMAVVESDDALWRAYFSKPFDDVQATPEVKNRLREALFLTPEPYVRRIVMIATPHRGSLAASFLPGQILQPFIVRPQELRTAIRDVSRQNDADVLAEGVRLRPLNGVGELSPRDPGLQALLCLPIAVPYHSIIPQIQIAGCQCRTDGFVRYSSSHLDGAESETITRGFHTSHDSDEVTLELKRILCEHGRIIR